MLIGVCGNGYCGSSAITDYLHECDSIAVAPYDIEFMFVYDVDGLDDLRHHLVDRPVRFFSSDAAIKRFRKYIYNICSPKSYWVKLAGNKLLSITEEYINSIVELKWHGWWHYDVNSSSFWTKNLNFRLLVRLRGIYRKVFNKELDIYPNAEMYLSIKPEGFDQATREYIRKIVGIINPDNKERVVLDQPIPVGKYETYKNFFYEPMKIINVIRDPRDIYIASKTVNKGDSSWIANSTVEEFIFYYKSIYAVEMQNSENEILIRFEEMIYEYEETCKKINNFLGITDFKVTKRFFDPQKSKKNTNLVERFPQYKEDIQKIEKELGTYLYSFPDRK